MDTHKTLAQLRQAEPLRGPKRDESHLQQARLMTDGTHIAVYEIREVYGRPLAYPVNDQAETIQGLTGFKTLRRNDIASIEKLGFNVVTIHGERIKSNMIG